MSYEAKVFNVMIACPGDVLSERSIVREIIYEWNAIHSASRNIVLLPISWESHSSPEMGDRPQEVINRQVLEKSDILVGIFWTRIGTSTGEFSSGTVEEIEKHIAVGKPTMLYFSSQPVTPQSIQPEQFEKLTQFKDSCQSRGLYFPYDNLGDFKDKFNRQLQLKVNEHEIFRNSKEASLGNIVESKIEIPTLTKEARTLLYEASTDPNGSIIYLYYIGGRTIQINGQSLLQTSEHREFTKWDSAVQELLSLGLITKINKELFQISNYGYEMAEILQK